jgi:hypothetical protein
MILALIPLVLSSGGLIAANLLVGGRGVAAGVHGGGVMHVVPQVAVVAGGVRVVRHRRPVRLVVDGVASRTLPLLVTMREGKPVTAGSALSLRCPGDES